MRGFKDPLAAFLKLWSYTQHNHYQYPSLVIAEATLPISLSTQLLPFHIGQRLPPHRICQNHSVGPQCRSGKVIKRCEFFIFLLFSNLATGVPVLMWATVLQRHYESFFFQGLKGFKCRCGRRVFSSMILFQKCFFLSIYNAYNACFWPKTESLICSSSATEF